jgi:ACS family hexuronate transporter-like MFS transporter
MSNPAQTTGAPSHRWVILALLFFATTINYIDRQILALLKPMLDAELGWTNEQYGYVNSAFQAAYAFGLVSFGWFIDRFGVKIGYAVSIFAWSAAAAAHALVGSVAGFRWARVALGVGEGGNFPAAIKTVAQWFPRSERAFANALFNSGTNIGALIAPAVIPLMAINYGWRSTFIAAGALGIIWIFFWIPLFKEAPKLADEEITSTRKVPWLSLLGKRQAWAYMVAKFLTDPVWWFYLIWLPDYFKREQHLDLKASALPLVTLYGIVTVLSIFAGWLVKRLAESGHDIVKVRKVSMLIFALCSLPIFFVRGLGMWEAVLLIAFAASAHQAWSASLYATISDTFPKEAVASVSGLGGFVGSIGGMIFPIVAGRILDSNANGYAVLFGFCAFAYVVAFAIHHLLVPKLEMAEV